MTLNIVVDAPIPSASVSIARNANPGRCPIPRTPYLRSCQSVCMAGDLDDAGFEIVWPISRQGPALVQRKTVRNRPVVYF